MINAHFLRHSVGMQVITNLLGEMMLVGFCFCAVASAQSDAQLFSQGRIALDNYKDCAAAEKAFLSESSQGQNSPLWLAYMGRTEECMGKLYDAVTYFERYNWAVPGQAEIINKLGDLRYRASKLDEQAEELRRSLAGSSWDVTYGKSKKPWFAITLNSNGSCSDGDNCTWKKTGDVVTIESPQTDKSKNCNEVYSLTLSQDSNTLTGILADNGKSSFFGPDCSWTTKVTMRRRR